MAQHDMDSADLRSAAADEAFEEAVAARVDWLLNGGDGVAEYHARWAATKIAGARFSEVTAEVYAEAAARVAAAGSAAA